MIEGMELDVESFGKQQTSINYPYLEVTDFNDTLELVVSMLEVGEMKLIANYKGVQKMISCISLSAFNVDRLIRTKQKLRLHLSEDYSVEIHNIMDYLEVI